MKSKIFAAFFSIIMFICIFPAAVHADMGPKPSVVLNFEGIDDGVYYITLLSKEKNTGPYSYSAEEIDENSYLIQEHKQDGLQAWRAFRRYMDEDGFYFIEYFARSNDEDTFKWGYYPPASFKVLLYFPESDTFAVSEIYERYAFDSYYTVALTNGGASLSVRKSYDYSAEMLSFVVRVIATIAIEILAALLFGLKKKRIFAFIVTVNVITQIILNLLLNISNYCGGGMAFVFNYIWMELLVTAIEALLYSFYFKRASADSPVKKWVAPVYAVTANLLSFAAGLGIANQIPGIF